MSLSQNEILAKAVDLLKQVPYRTNFERENFLFGTMNGPRLLVELCKEIERLNSEYTAEASDWKKEIILEEMNLISARVDEILAQTTIDIPINDGELVYLIIALSWTNDVMWNGNNPFHVVHFCNAL